MKLSERWLRALCDPPLSSEALGEKLTMSGFEVEERESAAPAFDHVVVARIDAVAPHPQADRLTVCTVDAGPDVKLQVVCGAPNAAKGLVVPCALDGATLPGGMTIKRTTMRGVESQGMLCSAKELGIADDSSGLLVLDPALVPGTDLRVALSLDDMAQLLRRADSTVLRYEGGQGIPPITVAGASRQVTIVITFITSFIRRFTLLM